MLPTVSAAFRVRGLAKAPQNTASLPFIQATSVAPSNHFVATLSQVPLPPSPAPVVVLSPAAMPSLSQYSVTAAEFEAPTDSRVRANSKAPNSARIFTQLVSVLIVATRVAR